MREPNEKADLLRSAILAGNYLINAVKKNGQFRYCYRPKHDKVMPGYNILRHAGTIYAMLDLYEITKEKWLLEKCQLALQYLLQQIHEQNNSAAIMCCVVEKNSVKLGGNALAILALANYMRVTHDEQYLQTMRKLAEWICYSQTDSGKFQINKQRFSTGKVVPFDSEYYPGEAIFALIRLYQLDPNSKWLNAAENGAKYLIEHRDAQATLEQQIHDHWLLYGLSELYQIHPNKNYIIHASKIANAIILKQHKHPANPDWQGGFYEPPRSTPTAVRTEGLAAIYPMIKAHGDSVLAKSIYQCMKSAIQFQLRTQFLPESAMNFSGSKSIIGAFHRDLTSAEIRIDYVQHNISALLGFYKLMPEKLFKVHRKIVKTKGEACKILFVGDTSFGENYHENNDGISIIQQKGYDYFLKGLDPLLQQADLVIANLETPLTDLKTSEWAGKKTYVHWSHIDKSPLTLKQHHIDVVSLANNHSFDYGMAGFQQTLASLKKYEIDVIGAGLSAEAAAEPYIIEIQQPHKLTHIAILACFEYKTDYEDIYDVYAKDNKPGLNKLSVVDLARVIQAIKKQFPDIYIIVCPHWGPNYQLRTEKQKKLAEQLVIAGANLIIGHGAHMLQEIENEKGTWIFYSLGNFMFTARGRYAKFNVPPYSAVANLIINDENKTVNLYPILTNNLITDYQSRTLNEEDMLQYLKLDYLSDQKKEKDHVGNYLIFLLNNKDPMPKLNEVLINNEFYKRYNEPLWFSEDISSYLKGEWISGETVKWFATGVCYRLGEIMPNDLLFIRRMNDWDGSNYLPGQKIAHLSFYKEPDFEKLFSKGVAAIIVDAMPKNLKELKNKNYPIFFVDNTFNSMTKLAAISRERFKGETICITGTVGKSSTKEALFYLLSQDYRVYVNNVNFNHRSGLTLSLTQTPENLDYAIYEFGVDRPANTLPKALLARPNIAIITEIQADHLNLYNSLEEIAKQKSLLFEGLRPGGIAILNHDSKFFGLLYEKAKMTKNVSQIITFGCNEKADVCCKFFHLKTNGSDVMISIRGINYQYTMKLPGRHMVMNSLGVIAIFLALKLDLKKYLSFFNSIPIVHKKNELFHIQLQNGSFDLIDDTTNANPASMATAFRLARLLKSKSEGRLIVVIFALHDLGKYSAELHKELANVIIETRVDKVYCIGADMLFLYNEIPEENRGLHSNDVNVVIKALIKDIQADDLVLIKGSTHISEQTNAVVSALKKFERA